MDTAEENGQEDGENTEPAVVNSQKASACTPRPVVAVANRLPVQQGSDGWELSPGGLVTALRPVMARGSGIWVGWDGGTADMPDQLPNMTLKLQRVSLSPDELAGYYHGFSNRTLWPLLHNALEKPVFERDWWRTYRSVNETFASAAIDALTAEPDALLWVHDYHLMLVPKLVRDHNPEQRIGYFLHVPWPAPDLYVRLPWRADVLRGLLGADVVSFHTEGYRRNFVQSCARVLGDEGITVRGTDIVVAGGRVVRTTSSPISIDVGEFNTLANSSETRAEIAKLAEQFSGRTVLLGVDRLDYTKGIVERLVALEVLLERREDLRSGLVFVQVAVPSRDDVQEYRDLRATVEQIVGRINGRFTQPGQDVPVHYLYRSLPPPRLAAYYATADALLVTPLMDGMNLVAKEYVVVQQARQRDGVLILSEFTGAALELRNAALCNPFDVEGLALKIEQALARPAAARRASINAMARRVRKHDVHQWVQQQLAAIQGAPTPV